MSVIEVAPSGLLVNPGPTLSSSAITDWNWIVDLEGAGSGSAIFCL